MSEMPYRDPSLSVDERVADLVPRLSSVEKVGQLTQLFCFPLGEDIAGDEVPESGPEDQRWRLERLRKVEQALDDGALSSLLFVQDPQEIRRLQERALQGSRWQIPLLFGFDVIHGFRTIFPVPIALAASWDPSLAEEVQRIAAREARSVGMHWAFAPMVDIARDPRWGRIVEGAGEDPVLGAAFAAAQVRGFQGDLGPEALLAGPKHFVGYGAALGGRDYEDADISDAELHNVYVPPFRAAVEAGARNIMSAYMDLNGVPATGNEWLLKQVLRDDWGFDGFVVSDANAVKSLVTQHFARDDADASVRALNAGLDMEMAIEAPAFASLADAVESGMVDPEALDQAVSRVLHAKFALGLFEDPFGDAGGSDAVLDDATHRDLAQEAAERSAVLLKNDGVLPLRPDVKHIVVCGYLADSRRDTLGPWIFNHDTAETTTILEGIRRRAAGDVTVDFVAGTRVQSRVPASMFDAQEHEPLPSDAPGFDVVQERRRAVGAAAGADVAIVVVGQPQNMIGEKASSSTMDLHEDQVQLLQQVQATGTPTVVLVMSGRPVDLRWAHDHAQAIMQVWYPGTRGGEAVARLLFGDVSPAGRLPYTWPRHVGQVPIPYSHYRTFAPHEQDERYWDEPSTPLYDFGHGMGYATFDYTALEFPETLRLGATGEVAAIVTNTSDVAADEVVQLYIHQRHGTSSRPVRELKGFRRLHLEAGASTRVSFPLGPDQLGYWSAATRAWVQDATKVEVHVGGSLDTSLDGVVTIS